MYRAVRPMAPLSSPRHHTLELFAKAIARRKAMRIDRNVPLRLLAVLALAVALLPWPSGLMAAGAFDTLLGSWQGAGQIRLSNGRTERLKCNAYYNGGGWPLRMAIRRQREDL